MRREETAGTAIGTVSAEPGMRFGMMKPLLLLLFVTDCHRLFPAPEVCPLTLPATLTTTTSSDALTADEFIARLTQILCGPAVQVCCGQANEAFNANGCTDQGFPDPATTLATFNAQAAQTCLDEANTITQSCAYAAVSREKFNPDCAAMWTGTVAAGGTCRTNWDCADGFCEGSGFCSPIVTVGAGGACNNIPTAAQPTSYICGFNSDCVSGTCRPLVSEGVLGPCHSEGHYCASGLYCDDNGVCQALGVPGQSCPHTFAGLVAANNCDGYCDNGICRAYVACGKACTPSDQCDGGEPCDPGTKICDGWAPYADEFSCSHTAP